MQSKDTQSRTPNDSTDRSNGTAQQVPFFRGDPNLAQLFEFLIDSVVFVKTAVTSEDPQLRDTDYAWNTEYWGFTEAPGNLETSMSMSVSYAEYTAAEIDEFFTGYNQAFSVGQSGATWTQWSSTSQPNTGSLTWYLYQAPDPDSTTSPASIGLALGVNGDTFLEAIVWYKTWNPTNGFVWQPANSPTGLNWTYVGQTTNPSGITPTSSTWYWVQQGSV